jgi:hypothetical protein
MRSDLAPVAAVDEQVYVGSQLPLAGSITGERLGHIVVEMVSAVGDSEVLSSALACR